MDNGPTVKLLHYTPLWVCSDAIRTCWNSNNKSDTCFSEDSYFMGQKDLDLIDRVGNKFKHSSTLEHLYYNMHLSDVSRALLQELARHRHASLSVKSSRYTLKELKSEDQFNDFHNEHDFARASKYLVWSGVHDVDITTFFALEDLRSLINEGISNDLAKLAMPENYKTELAWSINARSLQNFLNLRTNKAAFWEIRKLAHTIFEALPDDHKYLFEDCIYTEKLKEIDENCQN